MATLASSILFAPILVLVGVPAAAQVLTAQYDNARTSATAATACLSWA